MNKHPCCTALRDFRHTKSKPEVRHYLTVKLILSQKLRSFRGSRFSLCLNCQLLSPLLVKKEKKVFMLTIILSNYQQCPVPLNDRFDAATAHLNGLHSKSSQTSVCRLSQSNLSYNIIKGTRCFGSFETVCYEMYMVERCFKSRI